MNHDELKNTTAEWRMMHLPTKSQDQKIKIEKIKISWKSILKKVIFNKDIVINNGE